MTATARQPAPSADATGAGRPASDHGEIKQAGEQRSRRLESLRALGWLAVFGTHVLLLALGSSEGFDDSYKNRFIYGSGVLALYLFFAMSGYLLYLPFARHALAQGRTINVGRYLRNRGLRILPLYFTVIVVLLIIHPLSADRGDWWRWLTFTQNFSEDSFHRLNAPLWSVAVEVQFYVALPLLAWLIARLAGASFRRTVGILVALAIASWIVRSREVINTAEPNYFGVLGKHAMPSYLYAFIGGMLLAVLRLAWDRRPPAWALWPVVGASGAWIAAGLGLHLVIVSDRDLLEPYVAFAAAAIVGACVLPLRGGRFVDALEWRPLAALGLASFSLYLWHWPILEEVSGVRIDIPPGADAIEIVGGRTDFKGLVILGLPVCIAVGIASYWLIERPFLRQRKGWGATAATPRAADDGRSSSS